MRKFNENVHKLTDEELKAEKIAVKYGIETLNESSKEIDDDVGKLRYKLLAIAEEEKNRLQKNGGSVPEVIRLYIDAHLQVERNGFGLNDQTVRKWLLSLPGVKKVSQFPDVEYDLADDDPFEDDEDDL